MVGGVVVEVPPGTSGASGASGGGADVGNDDLSGFVKSSSTSLSPTTSQYQMKTPKMKPKLKLRQPLLAWFQYQSTMAL